MPDFWDEQAEQSVDAPPAPRSMELPDNTRLIVKTCTSENGGAAPKLSQITTKNGEKAKLNLGFVIEGGDATVPRYKEGSYVFGEFWVHKRPEETANIPCAGDLYNFILDALAPTDSPVADRWASARARIVAKGREMGLDSEHYNGDMEMLYAVAFKEILLSESFTVVGRTFTRKPTPGSTYVPKQQFGSIEAATPEVFTKRKVSMFNDAARAAF